MKKKNNKEKQQKVWQPKGKLYYIKELRSVHKQVGWKPDSKLSKMEKGRIFTEM